MSKCLAGLLLASMLSSCATVKTSAPAHGAVSEGISYYLPHKDMKITIERTVLKLDDAKKKVAAAQKAADEADAAAKAAAADLKAQEALLPLLAAGSDAWKNAEAARATAAAKKTLTAAAATEAKAALASAQAEQARIEANAGSQCLFKYDSKLELLAAVPDHGMRFTANYAHNVMRDDDGKLAVTPDGLLTSSNVVAADRTGDIIVEIAGAIAGFGTGGGVPITTEALGAPADCGEAPPKFVYQFDPLDYEDANKDILRAGFPIQLDLRGMRQEGPDCLKSVADEQDAARAARLSQCAASVIGTTGKAGALFYRSAVPVTVIIKQCKAASKEFCSDPQPVDAALVLIPQLGPISYIPMRSSAFVKTVDDVTFSNGSITSWNASRPSEVFEVVRLPVRILTAIISVPAQILSLRVNLSDKDKALAASQQAQIAAQSELAALKSCLASAERDGTNTESCFAN
jgi:multidrug efflux pump subunit AcrA (membrane-fusion protein)